MNLYWTGHTPLDDTLEFELEWQEKFFIVLQFKEGFSKVKLTFLSLTSPEQV